ncbi:hypothetical protein [Ruegeria sp. EL01]|uniref:hypothetical protein n=1 Tax=Ruegeria sp. EL01 TaxID=2107578 RepID=UPI0013C47561|nr:hypothetical protein [Ruegeria sp. EL01]
MIEVTFLIVSILALLMFVALIYLVRLQRETARARDSVRGHERQDSQGRMNFVLGGLERVFKRRTGLSTALIDGLSGDFSDVNYREESTKFLEFIANELAAVLTLLSRDKCCVSIKLLVPGGNAEDETPFVQTFFRDQISYAERDGLYSDLEPFPMYRNTMMHNLLKNADSHWCIIENNLRENAGYENPRRDYHRFFNSSAVQLIGDPNTKGVESVLGFLCVDNRTRGFDVESTRSILSIFSSTIYYCLLASAALEQREVQTEVSTAE